MKAIPSENHHLHMHRRPLLSELSLERQQELAEEEEFLHQRLTELAQENALRRRSEAPLASYLLREMLLDQIRPPGFQELFKP